MASKPIYGIVLKDLADHAEFFKGDVVRLTKSDKGQYDYRAMGVIPSRPLSHYTYKDSFTTDWGLNKESVTILGEDLNKIPEVIRAIYNITE